MKCIPFCLIKFCQQIKTHLMHLICQMKSEKWKLKKKKKILFTLSSVQIKFRVRVLITRKEREGFVMLAFTFYDQVFVSFIAKVMTFFWDGISKARSWNWQDNSEMWKRTLNEALLSPIESSYYFYLFLAFLFSCCGYQKCEWNRCL